MRRRDFLCGTASLAAGLSAPNVGLSAATDTLRFIPQGDLNTLDPVHTPSPNVRTHGYMVFDTLFGIDNEFRPVPQMIEGFSIEEDGREWQLRLRAGLRFHDGSPVLARDCVASVRRFCKRDPIGQALADATDELSATGDRTFRFRLRRPFPLLPDALSSTPFFMPAIMPERLARTDPLRPVGEVVGSGPFRFEHREWVPGARYVYSRNDDYVPRAEGLLGWTAGPKHVHLGRVEWTVMADPATAFAALVAGEADWWELADFDLLEAIRARPALRLEVTDRTGMKPDLRMNQAIPPFDNPTLRRALLPAIDQCEFCTAMVGDSRLATYPVGLFSPLSPLATDAGLDVLTSPRDPRRAKAAVEAAGYGGEPVVLLSPSNIPTSRAATLLQAQLFRELGFNVDYQEMDWAALAARRTHRDGWNTWILPSPGLCGFNPAEMTLLRTGREAFFGWPVSERLETLRQRWLEAPAPDARAAIAREIQVQALIDLPSIPLGIYVQPTAFRREVAGVLPGFATFWNVRKG